MSIIPAPIPASILWIVPTSLSCPMLPILEPLPPTEPKLEFLPTMPPISKCSLMMSSIDSTLPPSLKLGLTFNILFTAGTTDLPNDFSFAPAIASSLLFKPSTLPKLKNPFSTPIPLSIKASLYSFIIAFCSPCPLAFAKAFIKLFVIPTSLLLELANVS